MRAETITLLDEAWFLLIGRIFDIMLALHGLDIQFFKQLDASLILIAILTDDIPQAYDLAAHFL